MSSLPDAVGVEGVSAVLAATIDAAATSFSVQDGGSAFPASAFQVQIDNEVILVGSRSGNVFSSLTRGQEGTAAHAHPIGTAVEEIVGGEVLSQPIRGPIGPTGAAGPAGPTGAPGGVTTAFGRTGAVAATAGDYTADQIDTGGTIQVFSVKRYGATGDGTTDDAAAIQAALDAAYAATTKGPAVVWLPTPASAYKFGTQLVIKTGVSLCGPGFEGNGPILNWTGPDATHAIVADAVNASKLRVSGFQILDARTSPTSGDLIHLATTNGTIVEHIGGGNGPGATIYLGATSGTPDNYTIRHCWVGSKGGYGIILDHCSQAVLVEQIKGDSSPTGMKALIKLMGSAGGGRTNHIITGLKMEVSGTPSPLPDLIYIDSTFNGTARIEGLTVQGNVGYLVNNQSSAVQLDIGEWGSVSACSGYLNDGPGGTVIGPGTRTKYGRTLYTVATNNPPVLNISGTQAVGVKTLTNAGATLDGSYNTVLVSAGASNRTIALPAASLSAGFEYTVKKIDSGVGTVIIDPNASETIDGATTYTISAQYGAAKIVCDGTAWNIVSKV